MWRATRGGAEWHRRLDGAVGRLRRWRPAPGMRALALGIVGAVLAVQLFSPLTFSIDPFTIRLDLTLFDGGQTLVRLPPFGEVAARTHLGPVGLGLTLVRVDLGLLGHIVETTSRAAATAGMIRALERSAALFTGWVLLLALAGGALLPVILGERDWRRARAAALSGLTAVGAVVLLTWGSYRVTAFRQARFAGDVSIAPTMVGLLDTTFRQARRFEQQLPLIAENLYRMFGAIQRFKPLTGGRGWRTVMLVSDIHDNPEAFVLMRRMARAFHPDFVLDAGDLTDFGTPIESKPYATEIPSLHLPYLIAPGNHETPAEIAMLRRVPGVTVLDGQEVVEDGVPIVGIADPSSANALPTVAPPAVLAATASRLAADVARAAVPPTIVVAHNPNVVQPLIGLAPILVSAHTHTVWVRVVRGGVWLNDGTTGAAGIREFTAKQPVPYSLMILYIARTADGRQYARAVETLRLTEVTGTLDVSQQVFAPPA